MPSDKVNSLLEQIPGPDNQSVGSPAEVEKLERAIAPLLSGDAEVVGEFIAVLREPAASDKADQKARYALHIAAVKTGDGKHDEARRKLAGVFAGALAGDAPVAVKKYLVRELQVCGDGEAAPALGKLLTHEDAELADTAAQALTAIRAGAAEQFRAALSQAKGPQRVTIVQNLGVLQDKEASAALQQVLNDEDVDLRIAAAAALANIGDASAAEALTRLADKESGFARARCDDACLLLAERIATSNADSARKIYTHLRDARKEPREEFVRAAAERGLAALKQ